MGLWRFLGGEINYDRVNKQINKEIKYQNELLEIWYKQWKKSDLSIEEKIKSFIQTGGKDGEKDFKLFLQRYPELVPDELNPFIENPDYLKELEQKVKDQEERIKKLEQEKSYEKE